jgi:hypothetical protein
VVSDERWVLRNAYKSTRSLRKCERSPWEVPASFALTEQAKNELPYKAHQAGKAVRYIISKRLADWLSSYGVTSCLARSCWIGFLVIGVVGRTLFNPCLALAEDASPFENLAGRWVGEGRLGIRDGVTESVKCRVTYILSDQQGQVRQTIRCASESGTVEVQSIVTYVSGVLSGTWKELSRNWSGELAGRTTPNGYKVAIKGSEFNANMDIIVKDQKQIIEIQFMNSSLIGLTLVLTKG